jgi:FtsZ-binding cell division protein ZapB
MKVFVFLTFFLILCYCSEENNKDKNHSEQDKGRVEELKEKVEEVYEEAQDWWEKIKWLKDKLYKNKKN